MSNPTEYTFAPPSDGFWARAWYTPLRDALRGRLSARLDVRRTIAAYDLPEPAAGLIYEVVRRTRLSAREKDDVVRELATHFADGLEAGAPADRLVERFGSPQTAAKLIRRAKLRQRSRWARALRAAKLGTLGLLATAVAIYLAAFLHFRFARPTLAHDYWREANALRRAPAGAIPAWPLYQRIEAQLSAAGIPSERLLSMTDGPQGPHWDEAAALVREHRALVDLIHEASSHPHLGYLLEPTVGNEPREPNPSILTAPLRYANDMRSYFRLAIGDAYVAAADGDSTRVLADIRSLLQMSAHCWQRQPTLVEQLIALAGANETMLLINRLIDQQPDLFSDEQLRDLAHLVAGHLGGGRLRADFGFERWLMLDTLQRTFTDNGHGNGVLTADGLHEIARWHDSGLFGMNHDDGNSRAVVLLLGPPLMLAVADRQEQLRVVNDYFNLAEATTVIPPWQWTNETEEFIHSTFAPSFNRQRYFPIALLLPAIGAAQRFVELATQRRDATLVVLALELYRRRHGDWPQGLADLTPGLLPEVPVDRCDGQPLRYLLREGRPVLYSLGANFADEGGLPGGEEAEVPNFFEREKVLRGELPAESADWILFPPRPPKNE